MVPVVVAARPAAAVQVDQQVSAELAEAQALVAQEVQPVTVAVVDQAGRRAAVQAGVRVRVGRLERVGQAVPQALAVPVEVRVPEDRAASAVRVERAAVAARAAHPAGSVRASAWWI